MKKEVRFKLSKHIMFLERELKDYEAFSILSWKEYDDDIHKRRDVERWVENIINSSIDISKIILQAEEKNLPDTYKEIVMSLHSVLSLKEEDMKRLSELVKLRNIVSHEYLDIRWASIKRFISETEPLYNDFLFKIKTYLEKKISEDKDKEISV